MALDRPIFQSEPLLLVFTLLILDSGKSSAVFSVDRVVNAIFREVLIASGHTYMR